jgi:Family of unknown function (DUF6065)
MQRPEPVLAAKLAAMPMWSLAPRRSRGQRGGDGSTAPTLTAYLLECNPAMRLVRAPAHRDWMSATPKRFANRCLPLLIANQAGWLILNPFPIQATWNGTDGLDSVLVEALDGQLPTVGSHFGAGVLTWNVPYLFRTSPGYNLQVRGPANWPKDGASPLEGIVETDWSPATFTMNWKLTRPGLPVVFDADEPICLIVPQRRGELDAVRPRLRHLVRAPAVAASYARWSTRRAAFLNDLQHAGSEAQRREWQRDYVRGLQPDGSRAPGHQTKLSLRPFKEDDD